MDENKVQELKQQAEDLYRNGDFLCSEAVLKVINDYLGQQLPPEAIRLASGFPVGIGGSGCTCGALVGAVMALGLSFGRSEPRLDNKKVMALSHALLDEFHARFGSTCCRALIRKYEFGSPQHIEHCITVTGAAAEMVARRL